MAGSRAGGDDSAIRLNLSYVLHEQSDSRTVRRQARICRRFLRHRAALTKGFADLTDTELAAATLVAPHLSESVNGTPEADQVLTVSLGLSDLLPRALSAHGLIGPRLKPEQVVVLDRSVFPDEWEYVQLFRASAALPRIDSASTVLVTTLLARPGESTLMLAGGRFDGHDTQSTSHPLEHPSIRTCLESIIRDHVDQWSPERALWDQPAERVLPEFVSRSRATGAP